MGRKFEFRKGFLKLQRLGPVKFGEQSRWSVRAPESSGLWAFPSPHFDIFYAYHRYTDLAPKELRERFPSEPKWYLSEKDDSPLSGPLEFRHEEESDYNFAGEVPGFIDEDGEWQEAYISPAFYEAKDRWVEEVGKKILPLRTFWYSGDLYTHFKPDGSVGNWTMAADEEGNEWSLMSTEKLARIMQRPGSVKGFEGNFDGDGKPRAFNYSRDHLEVFIPRGRGVIRDRM